MSSGSDLRRRLAIALYVGCLCGVLATNVYAFVHFQIHGADDRGAFPRDRNRQYALELRSGRSLDETVQVHIHGVMNARIVSELRIDYALQSAFLGHDVYAPPHAALQPSRWRWRSLVTLHIVPQRAPLSAQESWPRRSASRQRVLLGDLTIHLPYSTGAAPSGDLHLYSDHADPNTLYVVSETEHTEIERGREKAP